MFCEQGEVCGSIGKFAPTNKGRQSTRTLFRHERTSYSCLAYLLNTVADLPRHACMQHGPLDCGMLPCGSMPSNHSSEAFSMSY
jgi:hypothetical protein